MVEMDSEHFNMTQCFEDISDMSDRADTRNQADLEIQCLPDNESFVFTVKEQIENHTLTEGRRRKGIRRGFHGKQKIENITETEFEGEINIVSFTDEDYNGGSRIVG